MKKITIDGRELEYKVYGDFDYDGESIWTEFYDGTITTTRKKYWLFGEEVTITEPKNIFTLNFNIEDAKHTKGEVRRCVEKKLELMNRKEELKRGEII